MCFRFVFIPLLQVNRSMSSLLRSQSEVLGEIRKELYDDHEFRQVTHVFVIMGASVSSCNVRAVVHRSSWRATTALIQHTCSGNSDYLELVIRIRDGTAERKSSKSP